MTPPHRPRRALCTQCGRPLTACLCRWVRTCDNKVPVLILQHPLEVTQAKGSARLLTLSLARNTVLVGEQFDPAVLEALLSRHCALLYPGAPGEPLPTGPLDPPEQLVVLDSTWRKSRKMLYLNPALQALPRVVLHDPPSSRYRIRKAHGPQQLSTLEATCRALQQLERRAQPYDELLAAFDGWVADQSARQHAD